MTLLDNSKLYVLLCLGAPIIFLVDSSSKKFKKKAIIVISPWQDRNQKAQSRGHCIPDSSKIP